MNQKPKALSPKLQKALFILLFIIMIIIGLKTISVIADKNNPGKFSADILSGNYSPGYYEAAGSYYYTNGTIWQKYDTSSKQWIDLGLSEMTFLEDGKQYTSLSDEKRTLLGIQNSTLN